MRANLRAAARAFRVSIKLRVISPWAYLNWIFFPVVITLVGMFILAPTGGPRSIYAVLGGGLVGYLTAAYIDGGNSIQDERWQGTLEQLMGVPTPLWVVMAGKMAASLLLGILSFLPSIAIAYLGFHARPPAIDPLAFAAAFAVLSLAFFATALATSPAFAMWRWSFSLINGFELGVWGLSGFMFPVAQLPGWAQATSVLVAPAWSTRALYAAAGQAGGPTALWLLWSLALSAAYIVVGLWLYRVVQARARISGQLAMV